MPYVNIEWGDSMPFIRGRPCYFCGKILRGNFRVIKLEWKQARVCGACDHLFETMFNAFISKDDEAIRKIYTFISETRSDDMRFTRIMAKFKTPYKPSKTKT